MSVQRLDISCLPMKGTFGTLCRRRSWHLPHPWPLLTNRMQANMFRLLVSLVSLEWPEAQEYSSWRSIQGIFSLCVNVGFDDLNVCADPGVPENGFRTPSGGVFFESSVTRYHCQDGFKLKGSTKRLCVKHINGTLGWVPSDRPVCIQEGKGPAPLWEPGM